MRILHIGPDSQFLHYFVSRMEELSPGENELLVLTPQGPRAAPGTKAPVPTTELSDRPRYVPQAIARARTADVVIAHSMTQLAALVLAVLPPRVVTVWSGWGYDYYSDDRRGNGGLLGPETCDLMRDRTHAVDLRSRVRSAMVDLARRRTARRTDYFSAPVPIDLAIFAARFPGFSGSYQQLNYGDVNTTFAAGEMMVEGRDILVGNSATASCNHLEVFRALSGTNLEQRRVVVPLTYGDPWYRDALLVEGQRILGAQFHPVVDHLPLDQYLDLLGSCQIMVFNHRRQQALGNIGAALYQGAHVYLDERNPLFNWFRSRGVSIQSVESLSRRLPESPVEASILARNRAFLSEVWGPETVTRNLEQLLSRLREHIQ